MTDKILKLEDEVSELEKERINLQEQRNGFDANLEQTKSEAIMVIRTLTEAGFRNQGPISYGPNDLVIVSFDRRFSDFYGSGFSTEYFWSVSLKTGTSKTQSERNKSKSWKTIQLNVSMNISKDFKRFLFYLWPYDHCST